MADIFEVRMTRQAEKALRKIPKHIVAKLTEWSFEVELEAEKKTITYERKKQKIGRRIDTSGLPREHMVHDLPEAGKTCDCCQSELVRIGEDRSEKLEFIHRFSKWLSISGLNTTAGNAK